MTEASEPKLRYNCYFLRDGITDPVTALRPKYRPDAGGESMSELAGSDLALPGAVAYIGTTQPKTPSWADRLAPMYPDLGSLTNQSNRLVLFVPVEGRWFAICFGYGSTALEWDAVVPNFGLRVAARRFKPDQVSEVRSRRIDASGRTQSSSVPAGGAVRDLGVELDGEFVRKFVGQLVDDGIDDVPSGSVMASDSIAFKATTDLKKVVEHLARMLTDLEKNAQEDFAFIDALEPLRNKQKTVENLEKVLAATLLGRAMPRTSLPTMDEKYLAFVTPDDVRLDEVEYFEVSYGGKTERFEDPTLESLLAALKAVGVKHGSGFLRRARVMAHGADNAPQSGQLPVLNWLVYEAGTNVDRYILTLGRWFKIAEAYSAKLDADLAAIPDVTATLNLPSWITGQHEGPYNESAASGRTDLALMDKVFPAAGSRFGKVESCDLFHNDGYLIHVKLYSGSQTLSHLFGQGAVSAEMLRSEQAYKDDFVEKIAARNPALRGAAESAPTRVTFAIAVPRNRALPTGLPIFSKVNLRDHVKRIRNTGATPSIARIDLV